MIASCARAADVLGPVLTGFLWAGIGPVGTYATIAILFGFACLVMTFMIAEKPPLPLAVGASNRSLPRIIEGVRYVFRDQILVGSMALDLFAVFFGGATALLPIFATDILHVGAEGFGILRSAVAAGALTSAVLATRFLPAQKAGWVLHVIIGGFGISMIVFGFSRVFLLSLAALFVAGLCDGLSMVIRHAILRLASPEELRGRIASVRMVFVGSSNELGALESGVTAAFIGASAAVVVGGVATLLVVGLIGYFSPRLRNMDLTTLRPLMTDAEASAAALEPTGTACPRPDDCPRTSCGTARWRRFFRETAASVRFDRKAPVTNDMVFTGGYRSLSARRRPEETRMPKAAMNKRQPSGGRKRQPSGTEVPRARNERPPRPHRPCRRKRPPFPTARRLQPSVSGGGCATPASTRATRCASSPTWSRARRA